MHYFMVSSIWEDVGDSQGHILGPDVHTIKRTGDMEGFSED